MSQTDNQTNNAAAQEKFGEAAQTGNFALFDEVVAASAVDHDPAPGQVDGPEGFKTFFGELRTAFPDFKLEVETQVAEGDKIAFAYTLTGTHQGDFMGIPATGKTVRARGLQISRFEDGKLVERWGSSDELGILKQLGHVSIDPDNA